MATIDQAPIKSPLFNGDPASVINSVPWLQWFQKVLGIGGSTATDTVTTDTVTTDKVRVIRNTAQGIPASGAAKIQLNSTEFDTNSIWDATNFRIIPKKEGYYQFSYSVMSDGFPTRLNAYIVKSGTGGQMWGSLVDAGARTSGGCALLYMNGTSDYVELYASHSTGSATNIGGTGTTGDNTFLSAVGPL